LKDLILRNEPYIAQYKPRRIMKKRLLLRDEHGKIRVAAKDPCQERKIITLGARVKLDPETCQSIMRRGFKHSIISGGILRNRVTGEREYRRYQIFKAERWTRLEAGRMHTLFKRHVPKERIGFYILHNGNLYTPAERLK
jgi:hypothetical protein